MGLICRISWEVLYKVLKKQSLQAVFAMFIPIQATSHLTLHASLILSAALPHRHLRLLLLDQAISGAQSSLDNLSSHCLPDGAPRGEDPGLTDRKETTIPESPGPYSIHEIVFWGLKEHRPA